MNPLSYAANQFCNTDLMPPKDSAKPETNFVENY